jgi:hypothetical protein
MRNQIYNDNGQRKASLFMTCAVIALVFFSLCNSLPLQAQTSNDDETAVATADASVDSVMDHSINMEGLNEAKSITSNDGIIVLNRKTNTVTVSKKPEIKPLQKKSELVERKPNTQELRIPILEETK